MRVLLPEPAATGGVQLRPLPAAGCQQADARPPGPLYVIEEAGATTPGISHVDDEFGGVTRLRVPGPAPSRPSGWGVSFSLPTVRRRRSWGIGDYTSLASLGVHLARRGADYVLLNPVCFTDPRPPIEASPYRPLTRSVPDWLLLDLDPLVQRVGGLPSAAQALVDRARATNRQPLLDLDLVAAAKLVALPLLWDRLGNPGPDHLTATEQELCRWLAESAVADRWLSPTDGPPMVADSELAAMLRAGTADEGLWAWVIGLSRRQLSDAQENLVEAGMRIGIVFDIPFSVGRDSADVALHPSCYRRGETLGQPPDRARPFGQNWDLAPFSADVRRLPGLLHVTEPVAVWGRLGGAVRLDHVAGFLEQYVIPDQSTGRHGHFVAAPLELLTSVAAIHAWHTDTVVVCEDLGFVADEVRVEMQRYGFLPMRVALMSLGDEPYDCSELDEFPPEALLFATNHDLPTMRGFLTGADLGAASEEQRRRRRLRIAALHRYLTDRGYTDGAMGPETTTRAMHRFVLSSQCAMRTLQLVDLAGQQVSLNSAQMHRDHPDWLTALRDDERGTVVTVEDLLSRDFLAEAIPDPRLLVRREQQP